MPLIRKCNITYFSEWMFSRPRHLQISPHSSSTKYWLPHFPQPFSIHKLPDTNQVRIESTYIGFHQTHHRIGRTVFFMCNHYTHLLLRIISMLWDTLPLVTNHRPRPWVTQEIWSSQIYPTFNIHWIIILKHQLSLP